MGEHSIENDAPERAALVVAFTLPDGVIGTDAWFRGIEDAIAALASVRDWSPEVTLHIRDAAERVISASVIPPHSDRR